MLIWISVSANISTTLHAKVLQKTTEVHSNVGEVFLRDGNQTLAINLRRVYNVSSNKQNHITEPARREYFRDVCAL